MNRSVRRRKKALPQVKEILQLVIKEHQRKASKKKDFFHISKLGCIGKFEGNGVVITYEGCEYYADQRTTGIDSDAKREIDRINRVALKALNDKIEKDKKEGKTPKKRRKNTSLFFEKEFLQDVYNIYALDVFGVRWNLDRKTQSNSYVMFLRYDKKGETKFHISVDENGNLTCRKRKKTTRGKKKTSDLKAPVENIGEIMRTDNSTIVSPNSLSDLNGVGSSYGSSLLVNNKSSFEKSVFGYYNNHTPISNFQPSGDFTMDGLAGGNDDFDYEGGNDDSGNFEDSFDMNSGFLGSGFESFSGQENISFETSDQTIDYHSELNVNDLFVGDDDFLYEYLEK